MIFEHEHGLTIIPDEQTQKECEELLHFFDVVERRPGKGQLDLFEMEETE